METHRGIISYQVIQEFLNVAATKFKTPLSPAEAKLYLHNVLLPLYEISPDIDFYETFLSLKEERGFSFYH